MGTASRPDSPASSVSVSVVSGLPIGCPMTDGGLACLVPERFALASTHTRTTMCYVLDAMGRSGLQGGVFGRQGRIRIARRGDSGMRNRAVSPSWRSCGRNKIRGAGAPAKNDAIGATAGKGTPVPKVEGRVGRGSKDPRTCERDMRANVDGCIQRRQVPARSGSGGDPLEVCQGGNFRNDEVTCQKDAKGC